MDQIGADILDARERLISRGVYPTRIELTNDDLKALSTSSLGTLEFIGWWIFGLEVRAGQDASCVAGKPKHGKYEVVGYEREPIRAQA